MKTAKNRAKRQKKKDRSKAAKSDESKVSVQGKSDGPRAGDAPFKKRRLVNGKELVFKRQDGEEDDEAEEDSNGPQPESANTLHGNNSSSDHEPVPVVETMRVIIHDD